MKPNSKTRREHPLVAIRRSGVPLVAFETTDPAATIASCVESLNGKKDEVPVFQWDIVNGQIARNHRAASVTGLFGNDVEPLQEPSVFLAKLNELAKRFVSNETKTTQLDKALVFVHNAHLYIRAEQVLQAVWNLRDTFKAVGATLVLLCPTAALPIELQNDVVIVSEPLPSPDELGRIVDSIASDAGLKLPADERDKIIDTLLGVSAFAAEQALSLSITQKGVDREALWERKRKMVEQTPGLTVWRGDKSEADQLGGLENAKSYLKRLLKSARNPVRCIMFLDEIEKLLGGAAGDLSGVAQDQLKVILTEMQDNEIPAVLLIGPPGTGKTALGHYAAAVADAEFIGADTGAMTGSLVGESQAKIRAAFKTFRAVGQGKTMIIATCNSIAALPPELRRRFSMGTFMVDLPDKEERKAIWPIWKQRFELDADTLEPDDAGWTGAEIKACCEIAYRMGMNLHQAAKYVVPVSRSAADKIEALRRSAHGNYISASKDGVYQHEGGGQPTGRRIEAIAVAVTNDHKQEQQEQE